MTICAYCRKEKKDARYVVGISHGVCEECYRRVMEELEMVVTKRWIVHIDCVDGETHYSMGSFQPERLLEFLDQHDHEGSTITLVEQSLNDERKLVEDLTVQYHDQEAFDELERLLDVKAPKAKEEQT